MKFEGILSAIVTPMTKDFEIDEPKLRSHIEFQIENGITGIVLMGGTGEYVALNKAQRIRNVEIAASAVNNRIPVIAAVLEPGYGDALEACYAFKNAGADAILLLTPYYVSPSQEGMVDYFQRIDRQIDIPILIYNIPYRTGVNMMPETVEKIVDSCRNIVGIKECSPDIAQNIDLIRRVGKRISVLSGEEFLAVSAFTYGASGGIIATTNVVPNVWTKLYALVKSGKIAEAHTMLMEWLPLFKALFKESNPGPIKYAMNLLNLNGGYPCTPLPYEPTEPTKQLIENCLREKILL